jgi:hypothetical protein
MTRPPRNTYTPGEPLAPVLHAIGRPVTMFLPGAHQIEAGVVAKVNQLTDVMVTYDIRVISGGTYKDARLGNLNNPQPNTFTYAP